LQRITEHRVSKMCEIVLSEPRQIFTNSDNLWHLAIFYLRLWTLVTKEPRLLTSVHYT